MSVNSTVKSSAKRKNGLIRLFDAIKHPVEPSNETGKQIATGTVHYAAIVVVDSERNEWRTIGVIAQDADGNVRIRIAKNDKLVLKTPSLKNIEEVYNPQFQEGEVRFYRRYPDEMSSHIESLKTTDPDFLKKYDDELAVEHKHIRLLNIRSFRISKSLDEIMEKLLKEVRS